MRMWRRDRLHSWWSATMDQGEHMQHKGRLDQGEHMQHKGRLDQGEHMQHKGRLDQGEHMQHNNTPSVYRMYFVSSSLLYNQP